MADRSDRTEQATGRQRQKALEKGQVARSRELVSMASTGGVVLAIAFWGGGAIANLSGMMRRLLTLQYGMEPIGAIRAAGIETIILLLPFLLAAAALAICGSVVQGGVVLKPFELKFSKLNPMEGLKRIFSMKGLIELGKNLLKIGVGGYVTYIAIRNEIALLPFLLQLEFAEAVRVAGGMVLKAILTGFSFFFVISVLDYFIQRWQHEQSLMMTKTEVKEEYKEVEGNPQVKARLRSLMRDLARKRMMRDVPTATVVITNPTHLAVALKYDGKSMDAPKIVAKGADFVAEKIREIARRNGVPIIEDKPLARSLYKIDLGATVPEGLYRAVARILAQIFSRHRSAV
ncbi:MAG: flagellar biosynthesis protein FlhB [Deltaproteobacteria bacterium]|nr:flagellar biosynthesis protein FlhB [Deltaproteobacteria bacterium]